METQNKSNLKYIVIGIAILFIILWFQGCFDHKTDDTIIIETKPIKVITPAGKPKSIIIHDTVFIKKLFPQDISKKDADYYKSETKRVLAEYDSLDLAFRNANDSLQQVIYEKSIQPKAFTQTWETDTLKSTVFGMHSGEIFSMQLKSEIKSRKQEIQIPQTRFRLLAGLGIGINKDLNQGVIKANLSIQNKKGNILTASYLKVGSGKFFLGEYSKSIWDFKR